VSAYSASSTSPSNRVASGSARNPASRR
jgi:hypothetical protein